MCKRNDRLQYIRHSISRGKEKHHRIHGKLHEVFTYLSELFAAADPLNEKMSVLLGIATYSYKRFKEIYEHQLFNSISGRSCVRVLIEDYIMMKYLVKMRLLMMIFGVTISCMAWAYISWFWQGTGKMVL